MIGKLALYMRVGLSNRIARENVTTTQTTSTTASAYKG
jgi:hypothetical protein